MPRRRRKRQRLGESTVPADRLVAEHPDHVWAIDFQWDQTADGHNLKLLHVVDEFTREALAIECQRRIDSDHTVDVLDRLVGERGTATAFVRCDNGPELTADRPARLVSLQPGRQRLHRPRVPMAERLRRIVRRSRPRRAARGRAVLLPDRSQGTDRGLAPGLQPPPSPQRPGDDGAGRVRRQPPPAVRAAHSNSSLGKETTRVACFPSHPAPRSRPSSQPCNNRVLPRRSPPCRPTAAAATVTPPSHPPSSHSRWTDERAPVTTTSWRTIRDIMLLNPDRG